MPPASLFATSSPLSISCQSHLNLTWVRASSPELAAASRASFLPSRAFNRPRSDLTPAFRLSRCLESLQPPADLLPTSRPSRYFQRLLPRRKLLAHPRASHRPAFPLLRLARFGVAFMRHTHLRRSI